jgi:hypothetical protein|tara:strand:- start:1108 stop:1368 length:261 start_codon:yes stop_codon:yes gene_type:complete
MNRRTIIKRLLSGVWIVAFRKVEDDSIREMKCSLMEEYVGKNNQKESKSRSKEVLPVWDIDSKGWRSFRFKNVILMKAVEGEMEST